jgi:hypothetical protein
MADTPKPLQSCWCSSSRIISFRHAPRFHNNGVLQLKLMFSMRSNKAKVTPIRITFWPDWSNSVNFLSARHENKNRFRHDWTTELNLRPYKLEKILPFPGKMVVKPKLHNLLCFHKTEKILLVTFRINRSICY